MLASVFLVLTSRFDVTKLFTSEFGLLRSLVSRGVTFLVFAFLFVGFATTLRCNTNVHRHSSGRRPSGIKHVLDTLWDLDFFADTSDSGIGLQIGVECVL